MKINMFLVAAIAAATISGIHAADTDGPSPVQQQMMELGFRVFQEPIEAPGFSLNDLEGNQVSLSDFRGKLVFLNFWATWCPPCRAEMPSMQTLHEELAEEEFTILAVDLQESKRDVADFIAENGFTFPVLLDTRGQVGSQYGARSIPTTYLIDKNGMAIAYLIGSRMWDETVVYETFRELMQ